MKLDFLKRIVFFTVLAGTCYLMKPEKVDARWDFDRGTGNWIVDYDWGRAYCQGSWWNNECEGTNGYIPI